MGNFPLQIIQINSWGRFVAKCGLTIFLLMIRIILLANLLQRKMVCYSTYHEHILLKCPKKAVVPIYICERFRADLSTFLPSPTQSPGPSHRCALELLFLDFTSTFASGYHPLSTLFIIHKHPRQQKVSTTSR